MAGRNNFSNATAQNVSQVLAKINDVDPDLRFMSLNDLHNLLSKSRPDFIANDYGTATRCVSAVSEALRDQNAEVQNVAIKCLRPLVPTLQENSLRTLLDRLSGMATEKDKDNSIPAMACRAVVEALPHPGAGKAPTEQASKAYELLRITCIPKLLARLKDHGSGKTGATDVDADALEVMIEIVTQFGPMMQTEEIVFTQNVILSILDDEKIESITKKRAMFALSTLVCYTPDLELSRIISHIIEALRQAHLTPVQRRMYINILGSLARAIPQRFGPYLKTLAPFVLAPVSQQELDDQLQDGDDEEPSVEIDDVREASLLALEAFVSSCSSEMRFYTEELITSAIRYISYDPNYNDEDEEDEEMEDDTELGSDDDFDGEEAFDDDDDDPSWKLRRGAAKVLRAMIESRSYGDLLEDGTLYSSVAPVLIGRFKDRDQNARLEIIEATSLLISKTGELPELSPAVAQEDYLNQKAIIVSVSRKRRRSSAAFDTKTQALTAAGLTSPVIRPVPASGPRSDLAKLSPELVKVAEKQLTGTAIATRQAVVNLLRNLVSVLPGGLSDYLPQLIGPLIAAIKGNGSASTGGLAGASATATVGSLREAVLKFISDLCKTHSSKSLAPFMGKIVPTVVSAAEDRNMKLSLAGIATTEQLIKALTPPRAQSTALAELQKLYSALVDRITTTDIDSEVRSRAIHALGIFLARTAIDDELLSQADRTNALNTLLDRMKNETTRIAAVRAIDTVATMGQGKGMPSGTWFKEVVEELAGQFRKADRALRGSSLAALRNLIAIDIAKESLDKAAIQSLTSALLPLYNTEDLHLLGPALLVTARLVEIDANTVVTTPLIEAISGLFNFPLSGAVLDALLLLVASIGEAGVSKNLMKTLLVNVGVSGEPSVTGKAIGTLIAAGGDSTGVSPQAFIKELSGESDDGRKSLALAVLGEIGLRMGASSGIQPNNFASHFSAQSAKLQLSAAVALGRAAGGDVESYLPFILSHMGPGNEQMKYLFLHAIKEVLVETGTAFNDAKIDNQEVWDELTTASLPEDNKAVGAECMGRLVVVDPSTYLPKVQAYLHNQVVAIRAMAYQALRYTLPDTSAGYNKQMRHSLVTMLVSMLGDEDLENQRLALTTLSSALHHKPSFILPQLEQVAGLVIAASKVRPELIREISLGPFKHYVDDGLETRKGAYESIYAMLEVGYAHTPSLASGSPLLFEIFDRIVDGLSDQREIFALCSLMLGRLVKVERGEAERRLDGVSELLEKILRVELKDSAVKQEVDKQGEAVRGALRLTLTLHNAFPSVGGCWMEYLKRVDKGWKGQLEEVRREGLTENSGR